MLFCQIKHFIFINFSRLIWSSDPFGVAKLTSAFLFLKDVANGYFIFSEVFYLSKNSFFSVLKADGLLHSILKVLRKCTEKYQM